MTYMGFFPSAAAPAPRSVSAAVPSTLGDFFLFCKKKSPSVRVRGALGG